jgi:type II secretory pathway pseudopilin PulG
LLAVIAVIGILAALLLPGLTAARMAVNKARTRVQFNEWVVALEGFRREYGYYPVLDSSGLVNPPGQSIDPGQPHLFHDVLAARRRDGSALPLYDSRTESLAPEAQNRKLIAFHAFGTAEIGDAPQLVHDAFGQTEIAVLVDRNLDGVVQAGIDFANLPMVGGIQPGWQDIPAAGIRAGVIFYAPAPGATVRNPGFIFSWK